VGLIPLLGGIPLYVGIRGPLEERLGLSAQWRHWVAHERELGKGGIMPTLWAKVMWVHINQRINIYV